MMTWRERQQITDVLNIKRHDGRLPEKKRKKNSFTYLMVTPLSCLSEETNKLSGAQVTVLISMPKLTYSLTENQDRL